MKLEDYIRKYLAEGRMLQVATSADGQPWICTVYYVTDQDNNIYWLSYPERRHSQEIEKNPQVAAAIAIKFEDKPVIGLQVEGKVDTIQDAAIVKSVMDDYVAKYDSGKEFYINFTVGTNKHKLYKLTSELFVLFDEVNFPNNSRQEWRP